MFYQSVVEKNNGLYPAQNAALRSILQSEDDGIPLREECFGFNSVLLEFLVSRGFVNKRKMKGVVYLVPTMRGRKIYG